MADSPPVTVEPAEAALFPEDMTATASTTTTTAPVGGLFPGTDRFVDSGGPPRTAAPTVETTPEGDITLNFVDADLREVVKAVLGDILRTNYVIDPAVQGVVTMQTSQPLSRAALLPALEQVLSMNNAAFVEEEGLYRVLPADRATRGTTGADIRTPSRPLSAGAGTTVVPLDHISATEVQKVLEPVAPPGTILRVDTARNVIMIGGDRATRENLIEVIDVFDVDWLRGTSFGLVPVRTARASDIADELRFIFGDEEDGPLAGLIRFVPVERLNAVLVISSRSKYLQEASAWIRRLDAGEDEVPQIFVYYCENSRAADLAAVLSQIFAPSDSPPPPELAPGLRPTEVSAPPTPIEPTLEPEAAAETLTLGSVSVTEGGVGAGVARGGGIAGVVGTVRIIPDENKNAIVVLATPRDFKLVEAALQRLDILPLQVLIEATIFEVTLDNELRYGVEWFFNTGDSSFTLSSLSSGAVQSLFPGFSYALNTSAGDVQVIVNALDRITDVNVVSSPNIAVLDNQTASLQVGDQIPIRTRESQSVVDPDAPIVSTIEYRDTGVTLNVTPRVNAGGLVTMEIEQDVSDVQQTETSDIDSPTIQQRKLQSTIAIQDGETVILGGLIRERTEAGTSGIPVLKEIPVLGALFGTVADVTRKTELMVVITPRVIRNAANARKITEELRRRMGELTPLDIKLR